MAFKLTKKLNKSNTFKKVCCAALASVSLFLASCQGNSQIETDKFKDTCGIKFQSDIQEGMEDTVVIVDVPEVDMNEVFFYVPSDETASSDKVSTIKLLGTSANFIGDQASYSTLLALQNQTNKPSSGGSTKPGTNSGGNSNVSLIAPDGKLSYLIQNNKYSSETVTVIQSERNDLSENTTALMTAINAGKAYDCGFLAIRISDGASIGYNVDEQWRCMSTFKAPTALYAYKLASEGKLDFSKELTYTSSKYYYPGSGVIKDMGSGKSYTLKTLISYSILHSDNSAYIMLRDYLNSKEIVNMCKDMGCTNYANAKDVWPRVSVRDAALWWNEIYSFCREDSLGKSLYTTFVNATGNMIDKALGYKYEVAHKSGSGGGYHHDCAVVMAEEPYILVLYTHNSNGGSSNYTYMSKIINEINKIMVG